MSLRRGRMLLGAMAAALFVALVGATRAPALVPYWSLSTSSAPANLAPGQEGKIDVRATNLGDGVMSAAKHIVVADKLPPGLEATSVFGVVANVFADGLECTPTTFPATEVSCVDEAFALQPSTSLKLTINVKVSGAIPSPSVLQNTVTVTGSEADPPPSVQPIRVSNEPSRFGVEKYELKPEDEGGAPDTRAGSHPFQLTTNIAINQNNVEEPVELPKNLQFNLPAGLLGNPNAIPQCSEADFNTILEGPINLCPPETAVGVAEVTILEPVVFRTPGTRTVPVFNLPPAPGEPARFGIAALKVPVVLDTAIRTGSDYGVVVTARNNTQAAGLISSKVTIWGVPGDKRHNIARGWPCIEGGRDSRETCAQLQQHLEEKEKVEAEKGEEPKPFLSLPTSCGTPLTAPMRAQSWAPGAEYTALKESEFQESLGECGALPFSPSISVEPEQHSGSTPTGLTVDVKTPQEEKPNTLAESAVRSTTVTLPEAVQLNPAAAGGLLACSSMQVGFLGSDERSQTNNNEFSPGEASCPDAAKVGTVRIVSPDLKNPLTGFAYLASQDTNPFEPPLVLYLIAKDPVSGVLVKLAGKVRPDSGTGQIVSTFENTPQAPFTDLKVEFFGGGRASVSTPPLCGGYTTSTSFAPWSGNPPATPSGSFNISSGPGGGSCSSHPEPFSPSFAAGSTNLLAGAFTPFSLTIEHPDGNQALRGLTMKLPTGVAAMLSSVNPCQEPLVSKNECGAESLIGHSTASSGLGGEPFTLPGQVFLTGPYNGAPFGLSVVTPAVAGPFNLGDVTVRSTINVDPNTAAVTINSDPFPTMLKGVPVQLKKINVLVDRPNFQFNPTNCNRMGIEGTLTGSEGGVAAVSSPFQVASCARLAFVPKLTASVGAQASKANGVSFNVKVTSGGFGVANIAKVDLALPAALPSRLSTIQKACPDAVFNKNPATCSAGSLIGKAIIHTPVLKSPLSGPAYLVSHGNAAFPDVEFVLQGEGIMLLLDGKTDIKKGVTYSRFESNPDAPFTTFETELPAGPHSALTAFVAPQKNYNLCGTSLKVPTEMTGQNGVLVKSTTNVAVVGCHGVKAFKATRAQLLAKALKACKKKKNKQKRIACEKAAHKKYGPKKVTKSHGKKKKK